MNESETYQKWDVVKPVFRGKLIAVNVLSQQPNISNKETRKIRAN